MRPGLWPCGAQLDARADLSQRLECAPRAHRGVRGASLPCPDPVRWPRPRPSAICSADATLTTRAAVQTQAQPKWNLCYAGANYSATSLCWCACAAFPLPARTRSPPSCRSVCPRLRMSLVVPRLLFRAPCGVCGARAVWRTAVRAVPEPLCPLLRRFDEPRAISAAAGDSTSLSLPDGPWAVRARGARVSRARAAPGSLLRTLRMRLCRSLCRLGT